MGLENLSRVSQEGTDGETRGDRSVIPTDSCLSPADVDVELLPILRGASVKVAVTPPSLRRPRPYVFLRLRRPFIAAWAPCISRHMSNKYLL